METNWLCWLFMCVGIETICLCSNKLNNVYVCTGEPCRLLCGLYEQYELYCYMYYHYVTLVLSECLFDKAYCVCRCHLTVIVMMTIFMKENK